MDKKQKDPYFDLILNEDLEKNTYPKQLKDIQQNPQQDKSIMAQVITKELFEKLKNKQTPSGKWTIAKAINTGVMNPESFVGCHAGDKESYEIFKDLFYPVIQKYHKGFNPYTDKHITGLNYDKITKTLNQSAKQKIISTRIRVARNLNFLPLNPSSIGKTNRVKISDLMSEVFSRLQGEYQGQYFRHTTMTPEEQQQLIDNHFLFKGKDKMQASSGYHQEWPYGRGIFINKEKTFMLWINEGDHCRIISMEQSGNLLQVFKRLVNGLNQIENTIKKIQNSNEEVFQKSQNLGYITCCPSNLGTGMRASVHLKIPHLIKKLGLNGINKIAQSMNCQARGSGGEHSQIVDRVDISNWRRLGFKEYDLIKDMIECVNYISELEDQESQIQPKL